MFFILTETDVLTRTSRTVVLIIVHLDSQAPDGGHEPCSIVYCIYTVCLGFPTQGLYAIAVESALQFNKTMSG